MTLSSRIGDEWIGICCCHEDPTCVPMGGIIITGSPNARSGGQSQSRLVDTTIGWCGHPGMIISSSITSKTNSLGKARLGEVVTGCNIGIIVGGNPTHDVGTSGGVPGRSAITEFQGRTLIHTEVDFGNNDDDADTDDGLNIYPPIPTVGGVPERAPTTRELEKSAALNASPTTTVEDSTSQAQITITPPVSCLTVTHPAPDNFQLSANFILSDLSIGTVLSKYRVRAQNSLTVQDIVCNLQGWAENVGETISTQFGRGEMIITSGFRMGSGASQHDRGQAADLQFPNEDNQGVYEIAKWIRDNVPFDQLILEYGGNNPWLHVSFNRAGNRPVTASNKFGTRKGPGNYVFGELLYMT